MIYLVHHAHAVEPDVDPQRPLSAAGRAHAMALAAAAAHRGVRPVVIWHSGKLRAKQTAQEFWRACNALAEFAVTKDLQPDDPPQWIRDRLRHETRNIALAGHFTHLPRLLALLTTGGEAGVDFPINGIVALVTDDEGETYRELWRIEN